MRKKNAYQVKMFSIFASILMIFSLVAPGLALAESNGIPQRITRDSTNTSVEKFNNGLAEKFEEDEKVSFIIKFNEKVDTDKVVQEVKRNAQKSKLTSYKTKFMQRSAVVSELKATALEEQQNVLAYLEQEVDKGNAEDIQSYFIVNGMSVTATKEVAEKVASFAEVEKILPNETRQLDFTKTADEKAPESGNENIEWNVEKVGAPVAWDMGIDGSGVVVATIDTGVEWTHPALKEKYRGYDAATGEVDHSFSWFDATAGKLEPYDDLEHGTHVTGTMVGGEPDGSNQIGVAPGAKWIAVKAFTDYGGRDTDLLAAAQWILAPKDKDGNIDVDKAPDIVNNSWSGGPGMDEWYRDVVRAWRAAEIFPSFAGGNTTSDNPGGPSSIASPANYPESFATGAVNINNRVASFSLLGPSPYKEIKPDIVAPGVNIRSAIPGGGYEAGWNGTSMATPAISGVAALLIQAKSSLNVNNLEDFIKDTATTLTDDKYPESPNNAYGYGLVNAAEAITLITDGLGTLEGKVVNEENNAAVAGHVSILENKRATVTNPEDGSYSLLTSAGEFTAQAEAYGYISKAQVVNVEVDKTTKLDFALEEIPKGMINGGITNKNTGRIIEDATIFVIEDANSTPVKSDEDGKFDLSLYEGDYTLKVVAWNYETKEIPVTIENEDIELMIELDPNYTYSGEELAYDDGINETSQYSSVDGDGWAVRMSLKDGKDSAFLQEGIIFFDELYANDVPKEFKLAVWDTSGKDGSPGELIAGPFEVEAMFKRGGQWITIDLREHNIRVDGDFYLVYVQKGNDYNVPQIGIDLDGPYYGRSYAYDPINERWWDGVVGGNYMVRSRVAYELDDTMITTPKEGFVTNEKTVSVEGIASPSTTVQLVNNGEETDEVAIGKDGEFTIPATLSEGENEITAISKFDGDPTSESDRVTVVLDTVKPELTLDSLKDGDKTNKEVAVVEGMASDNYKLDWVKVNGEEVAVSNGSYSTRILLNEGDNKVEVLAKDKAGNMETKTVTIKMSNITPTITKVSPSTDQYAVAGDKVEISFESDVKGGEASFAVKMPVSKSTQSLSENKMKEIKPGVYQGEWIVPSNSDLQGAVIEVAITDQSGNSASQIAEGNLYINQNKINRISSDDRYLTAIEVSRKGWTKSDTVVLSRGDDFADALSGVPYAHKIDAPILLTLNNKLYKETLDEIKRLGAKNVVILGGQSAISNSVTKELEKVGLKVKRIAGDNRFETATMLASEVAPDGADKVIVANGMDFPDALSVASHAANAGLPILLTQTNKIPKETLDAIEILESSQTIVVGGTTVVSNDVAKQLPKVTRLDGANRYETNIEIAEHFGVHSKYVFVATGKTYADALTGAVLAAKNDSTILLVHDKVPEVVTTYITDQNVKRLTILGGDNAVSDKVADSLEKLLQ